MLISDPANSHVIQPMVQTLEIYIGSMSGDKITQSLAISNEEMGRNGNFRLFAKKEMFGCIYPSERPTLPTLSIMYQW